MEMVKKLIIVMAMMGAMAQTMNVWAMEESCGESAEAVAEAPAKSENDSKSQMSSLITQLLALAPAPEEQADQADMDSQLQVRIWMCSGLEQPMGKNGQVWINVAGCGK